MSSSKTVMKYLGIAMVALVVIVFVVSFVSSPRSGGSSGSVSGDSGSQSAVSSDEPTTKEGMIAAFNEIILAIQKGNADDLGAERLTETAQNQQFRWDSGSINGSVGVVTRIIEAKEEGKVAWEVCADKAHITDSGCNGRIPIRNYYIMYGMNEKRKVWQNFEAKMTYIDGRWKLDRID